MNDENTENNTADAANDDTAMAVTHATEAVAEALERACELYARAERLASAAAEALVGLRIASCVAPGLIVPEEDEAKVKLENQLRERMEADPVTEWMIDSVMEFMIESSAFSEAELPDKVREHVEALVVAAMKPAEDDVPG